MNENNSTRRVDDKRPEVELDWSEPRFNALGIAETWSVTVEAEGRRVLCIGHQHYAGVSEAELDQFEATIRSCAMHLLGFMGANPAIAAAEPAVSPAPAAQAPVQNAEEVQRLKALLEKKHKSHFLASQAAHNVMVGNQAAWIEWQHGAGAEAAMAWIHNGLVGPGLIPDGKEAQPWFDANVDDRYEIPPMSESQVASKEAAAAVASKTPEVPLWDENGEPWNLAAEQVEYERAQKSAQGEKGGDE